MPTVNGVVSAHAPADARTASAPAPAPTEAAPLPRTPANGSGALDPPPPATEVAVGTSSNGAAALERPPEAEAVLPPREPGATIVWNPRARAPAVEPEPEPEPAPSLASAWAPPEPGPEPEARTGSAWAPPEPPAPVPAIARQPIEEAAARSIEETAARAIEAAAARAMEEAAAATREPHVPPIEAPETEIAPAPGFVERARIRRRARYLRRLREVQLRDIGGFVVELHRFGRERPDLVRLKVEGAQRTHAELLALERALGDGSSIRELREAGIGGACDACGAVHGSEDRYCASCGEPLQPELNASDDAAESGTDGLR